MARTTWKLKQGVTWRDKLERDHPNHGKVVPIPPKMQKRFGIGKMLIPKPLDLDALIRSIRKGKLITTSQLRDRLARDAGANASCPLTTGIFLRIVAEASEEDRRAGKKRVTPYWRVIRDDGKLNEKFPGGAKQHAVQLKMEGITITPGKGKQPPRVTEFEKRLARI